MWSAVTALMEQSIGSVFPSAQLVVLDGELRWSQAFGACSPSTIFDLASLTKPLSTVMLIAQLLEQRRATLDQKIAGGHVVRQLLSHSSGLPGWKALAPPGVVDKQRVLDEIARTPLEYEPGSRSVYSDLGFILLGELAADHLGPLDLAFTTRIAAPLGIDARLGFHPEAATCAPTEGELRGVVHDDNARAMGGVAGHAGLFGTADDVATVAHSLLSTWHGASGLISPSLLRTLWSPAGVPGSTWCLGWDRPAAHGSSAGELWPKDGVGHLAFTGCSMWLDPPRRRAVVLVSNRVYPTRANERIRQLRPQLHDLIVKQLDQRS